MIQHGSGVRVIADEHVWRHTPHGDKFAHRRPGLDAHPRPQWPPGLDMVPPLQKGVQTGWPPSLTRGERIEIVAMDGFTGFGRAAAEEP